ncbi:MAG: alpha/beta hydrolase [Planctomycetota bacterium]|jgi:alpha-beta hydrolase superfamily lysophospholipase
MTHRQRSVTVRIVRGSVRHAVRIVVYGLVGALLMAITLVVVVLERRPDLGPWHTVHLDEEFTADAPVESFDEYLALEERLFTQLDAAVYSAVPTGGPNRLDRYHRGSHADPGRWPTNWNRTFQFAAAEPRAGVLLLHGMSDAPYSMRSLGQSLHAHGATVVGLRVPGHGTAPSGLLRVRWEDMAAAVELAMKHLREQTGEQPLYIVGYSNGGALAVLYALSTLTDESLPPVRGLVLISPEIRVTKLAALAAWQERLGRLLGMRKLSWNSIKTEYDPFQYKSFALNAGKQAHRITGEIRTRITELAESGDLDRFPALLAFQSVVDTTVSAVQHQPGGGDVRRPQEGPAAGRGRTVRPDRSVVRGLPCHERERDQPPGRRPPARRGRGTGDSGPARPGLAPRRVLADAHRAAVPAR